MVRDMSLVRGPDLVPNRGALQGNELLESCEDDARLLEERERLGVHGLLASHKLPERHEFLVKPRATRSPEVLGGHVLLENPEKRSAAVENDKRHVDSE